MDPDKVHEAGILLLFVCVLTAGAYVVGPYFGASTQFILVSRLLAIVSAAVVAPYALLLVVYGAIRAVERFQSGNGGSR